MLSLGSIAFLQPAFLLGLLALPILWWLLRATPPAPKRERFPGVRVLLGLDDKERTPQRTPWWLLLLRILAVGALLLAFAEPILNPKQRLSGSDPLLIVMDGGWGSAPEWVTRRETALDLIDQAGDANRPVAVALLSDDAPAPTRFEFLAPDVQAERVAALEPAPWRPDPTRLAAALETAAAETAAFDTVWIHDGLSAPGAGDAAEALASRGALTLIGPQTPTRALRTPKIIDGAMTAEVVRPETGADEKIRVAAIGAAEEGGERRFGVFDAAFDADALVAAAEIDIPLELRNQISRLELVGPAHAAATVLFDDRFRRRTAALISGERDRSGQPLLSGLHYLRAALNPHAAMRESDLEDALGPVQALTEVGAEAPQSWADVIVLSDIGQFDPETRARLTAWVEAGGLLIRFAGPQLAAQAEQSGRGVQTLGEVRRVEDPLLPTRLRGRGRALGGAMSWSAPQSLRPFPEDSPFSGLEIPAEVAVTRQVLAEPGPELPKRVWAALSDGTPLITAKSLGAGRVVLFHVTANANWSSLPLSGLFVDLMGRLVAEAPALAAREAALAEDSGVWSPVTLLDGFGRPVPATGEEAPVEGADLSGGVRPGLAPGLYAAEDATLALNAFGAGDTLAPRGPAPSGAVVETLNATTETPVKPWLLGAAIALFLADLIAALALAGRLRGGAAAGLALALAAPLAAPHDAFAQAVPQSAQEERRIDPAEQRAALETVFAFVKTGDARVDEISEAGLLGLSFQLFNRTSIEPKEPAAVDLEQDELAVYSVLYWPITPRQKDLSDEAIRKLNAFARTGGLLIVDTQDAHRTLGGDGPNAHHLRRLVGKLDLPPLAPAPPDHVLMRSFYLIDGAPGRWGDAELWVEAVSRDATLDASVPQNANDGVSPIVLGSVDWASAWAIDAENNYLVQMGRGGASQREQAYRFGVNAAMYAFTGNYKSDQVHIPLLLERLGN